MSAAGLYESVANVSLHDDNELSKAIVEVWSSLYSQRAIYSRNAANVQQQDAIMAILIQEMVDPRYPTQFLFYIYPPLIIM